MSFIRFPRHNWRPPRRRATLIAVASVGCLVVAPIAQPVAAQGTARVVTPIVVDVVVSSCGFAVAAHIESTEGAVDLGDRIGLTYASAVATLTNLETDEVLRVSVPGPELVTFEADGTVVVSGPGPWLWLQRHPVSLEPGIWVTRGLVLRTFAGATQASVEQHGSSVDLCTELA